MSEQHQELQEVPIESSDAQPLAAHRKIPWYRRAGCLIALIIWLLVMLIPCLFITLAFQEEIVIRQGDLPNQVFRVWLINEARHRGLGLSTTSVQLSEQENSVCIQTNVRFLLWIGDSESTSYCECYASDGDELEFTGSEPGLCIP
jgi:hypothetical protein